MEGAGLEESANALKLLNFISLNYKDLIKFLIIILNHILAIFH